jgi:hypothetical protein
MFFHITVLVVVQPDYAIEPAPCRGDCLCRTYDGSSSSKNLFARYICQACGMPMAALRKSPAPRLASVILHRQHRATRKLHDMQAPCFFAR